MICRLRPPSSVTWPTPGLLSNCRRSTLSAYSVISRTGRFGDERDIEHRRGVGIEPLHARRVRRLRQIVEDAVHAIPHFLRADRAVFLQQKRDDDLRDAFAGGRVQLVNAADGVDRFLDLVRDLRLDFLRRSARHRGRDDHGGKVDLREKIHRQPRVTEHADDDEDEHEHRGEHGAFDGNCGEPLHRENGLGFAAMSTTLIPSLAALRRSHHHGVALEHTAPDFHDAVFDFTDLDEPLFDPPLLHHEDLARPAVREERGRRDGHGICIADRQLPFGKHAGLEPAIRVIDFGFDDEIALHLTQRRADEFHRPVKVAAGKAGTLKLTNLSVMDVSHGSFRHIEQQPQSLRGHELRDAVRAADIFADLRQPLHHRARERCAEHRIFQRFFRLIALRGSRGQRRFGCGAIELLALEVRRGDQFRLRERFIAVELAARPFELQLRIRHAGFRFIQRERGVAVVELQNHIAFVHHAIRVRSAPPRLCPTRPARASPAARP